MTTKTKTKSADQPPAEWPLYIVALAEEEKWELQRDDLINLPESPTRLLRAVGERTAARGGRVVAMRKTCFCPDSKTVAPDDEHPDLALMHVRRHDWYCPMHERSIPMPKVISRYTKTIPDKRKFYSLFRDPDLNRYYIVELGPKYGRTAVSANLREALDAADAVPGELARAVVVDCRDLLVARRVAEEKRDVLPFKENLKVRNDGDLDVDWHGMRLNASEARLLKEQTNADRGRKTARLDKLIRQVRAEHA